jgi:hypothetical protein
MGRGEYNPMARGAGGVVLHHGRIPRAIAVLTVLGALGGMALAAGEGGEDPTAPLAVLGAILLTGLLLVVESFGVAHRLRPDGIERVTPWRRRIFLPWAQVASLDWAQSSRSFELRSAGGEVLRIGEQLVGLAAFAREALANLPPAAFDGRPEVRDRLQRLADGLPPPAEEPPPAQGGG